MICFRRKGLKKKTNLVSKLDRVFSLYVRLRDCMPNGYGVCISCSRIKPFEEMDCGHFFSRVNMSTRFHEDNCHCECRHCNRFVEDHLIGYQKNLIRKIGEERYNRLAVLSKQIKKWSPYELEEMITYYAEKVRRLSAEKGIPVKI